MKEKKREVKKENTASGSEFKKMNQYKINKRNKDEIRRKKGLNKREADDGQDKDENKEKIKSR